MNIFGAYKIMLCRNISEIGKIPCQIVTKCPSAPLISEDTEILVLDKNKVHYKCKDEKFFDYPQLEYPQQVEAVCSQGELFQGLLPFWKIDNVTFPYKESPKCLSSSECSSFSKSFSTELINTYGKKISSISLVYLMLMPYLSMMESQVYYINVFSNTVRS